MKRIIISGMIMTIAVSPLFRGLYFGFEASVFFMAIAFLAVIYLFVKIARKETIHFNKWIIFFGFLLIAAYVLSFIKAANIRGNISMLIQYAEYFIISIILYDYYHDKKQQFGRIIMLSVIISGFINAVIGLEALTRAFSFLEATLNSGGRRIGATFQYANTAAVYFMICLLFSLTLIQAADRKPAKILIAGIGNTILLALILTGSRGGFIIGGATVLLYFLLQPSGYKVKSIGSFICMAIPALIFVSRISALAGSKDYISMIKWIGLSFLLALGLSLVYEYLKKPISLIKYKFVWIILLLFAFASVFIYVILSNGIEGIIPQNIIERFANISLNDPNIFVRLECDKDALKLISGNWLFGLGGGGWESLYQSVQDTLYTARAAHNQYFQVFVESGILGFISFISIILLSFYYGLQSLIKTKDISQKIFLAGLLCGFFSLITHSSFDFDLTYPSVAMLLWVLITGLAIYGQENGKKEVNEKKPIAVLGSNILKLLIVICPVLLSINALYTVSAYYADKGYNSMVGGDILSSRIYYEEAHRLDPINAVYTYQLSKIYNYFSDHSNKPENMEGWRLKAQEAAEKGVDLDAGYPDYRNMLARIYFNSNMPLEALESAEKLIELQPCNSLNYELLARGYLEAADYYIKNQNPEKGKELLTLCVQIDKLPYVEADDTINAYKEQASRLIEKEKLE